MKSMSAVAALLAAIATLVPASVTARNRELDRRLRRVRGLDMSLKKWKAIKNGIISVLVMGFGVFAMLQGAPPGLTTLLVLAIVATQNGLDVAEYVAAVAGAGIQTQESEDE